VKQIWIRKKSEDKFNQGRSQHAITLFKLDISTLYTTISYTMLFVRTPFFKCRIFHCV
jgi:hypothetical protein